MILQVSNLILNFKHVYKNNAYQQIIEDVNIPNSDIVFNIHVMS